MTEKIARYKPGENVTGYAAEDIAAGTFVECSGVETVPASGGSALYKIKPCGANVARPFGVAERSVTVSGLNVHHTDRLTNVVRRGCIAKVLCEGEVKAGEEVYVAGSGKVKKIASEKNACGRALSTGTDTYIEVDVY